MAKPTIVTRAGKGSALTWTEGDANFTNLQDATITLKAGSAGTDVVSDLNGTVTLVAGTNITLTGNNSTKQITIDATGGGSSTLDGLSDVVITAAATGDLLRFDGTNWVDIAESSVTVGAATTATNATNINISTTTGNTSDTSLYPVMVGVASTGNQAPHIDTALSYNASTDTLTATAFAGALNGTVGATTQNTGSFTGLTAKGTTNTAKLTLDTTNVSSTAWTTNGIGLKVQAATFTDTSSTAGTVSASHVHVISTPTMASTNAITVTDAATLYIAGVPTSGTNTTVTNKYALLVGGKIRTTGDMSVDGSLNANTGGSFGTLTTNGSVDFQATGSLAQEVRFRDNDNSNYVGFKAPGTITANKIWVLPNADGTASQALVTDGAGNLSWASAGGAPTITNDTTSATTHYPLLEDVTTGSATTVKTSSTKLSFVPSTGVLTATSFSGAGAFTTLSASSTVSGTGFSTYLASPPAIGGTAAAAGSFTTLSASTSASLKAINEGALFDLGTTGGTITPNVANGNVQKITLNSALTINGFTSAVAGQTLTLIIYGGTAYTSITSTMKFAGGVKTLTATAGCIDILSVYFDGTNYFASLGKGFA